MQIREYILEKISTGEWTNESPIPSENELCELFHVSRITVKQALDALVENGTVFRIQGKGTFIASDSRGEPPVFSARTAKNGGSMQSGTTAVKLLGYVVPRLNNMYMCTILGSIEGAAAEAGYRLVFARTHDNQGQEEKALEDLVSTGVSGIIIYPVEGELYNEYILKLILQRFPLVVIDRYLRGIETDSVCSDNQLGGWQATRHLLELGHTAIAFVSHKHQGTSSVEDRIAGYEKAVVEAGIAVDHSLRLLNLRSLQPSNTEEIKTFLLRHPEVTAVVAVNSSIGGQVITAARSLGKRIPEDLSIVLFDNRDPLPLNPTYIQQDETGMSRQAVALLLESISDPKTRGRKIEIPTRLVQGESSCPPAFIAKGQSHPLFH